jgi:hypothetical protein
MKRKIYLIIGLITALFIVSGVIYAGKIITITIDGKKIESDVPPQIVQNRTMVPIRVISEYFGADVNWRQDSMTVEITSPYKKFLNNYAEKDMYIKQADEILSLYNKDSVVILDVRGNAPRSKSYITGSMHIPMPQLIERIDEIPKNKIIAVYCTKNIKDHETVVRNIVRELWRAV